MTWSRLFVPKASGVVRNAVMVPAVPRGVFDVRAMASGLMLLPSQAFPFKGLAEKRQVEVLGA